MTYLKRPADIYRQSFSIIEQEADLRRFNPDQVPLAVRLIHACGMTDIVDDLSFSPHAMAAGTKALAHGAPILCDTMMVAHGIIRARLPASNDVLCALDDPAARRFAQEREHTRSAGGMHVLAPQMEGAVIAIGNAPTALFHLLEIVAETGIRPALVVGMPVGFVGAAESKQALAHNDLGVAFITVAGRRGGSAMAAAAINALAGAVSC